MFKGTVYYGKTITTQQLYCNSDLCHVLSPPTGKHYNSCEITLTSLTLHKIKDNFLLYRPLLLPSCHFDTSVKTKSKCFFLNEISQKYLILSISMCVIKVTFCFHVQSCYWFKIWHGSKASSLTHSSFTSHESPWICSQSHCSVSLWYHFYRTYNQPANQNRNLYQI